MFGILYDKDKRKRVFESHFKDSCINLLKEGPKPSRYSVSVRLIAGRLHPCRACFLLGLTWQIYKL